jgi:Na+-driven multidrug efflux pump
MTLCGLILSALMLSSTKPLLFLFGCTDAVWPFAEPYAKITALSFPCALWGAAGSFLMRADGSPGYALAISAAGAVLNIVLDALFIFGFGWGMQGAAWATALGQTLSALMVLAYLPKFRSMTLKPTHFRPKPLLCLRVAVMGAGPMINFLTQALVQVFLNGALRTYGAASQYGSEAALAAAGVANKVNTVATAVVTGLANGMQPIISYNYGRGNRRRVAETAAKVIWTTVLVSCAIVLLYQLVPRQITAIFGQGDEKYFEFAARFFRVFYLLLPLNGLLSSVGGLFSAQGKPGRSILLSLTRQALLLPPLLLILPRHFGLDGALWSGPSSDLGMAVLALFLFRREYRRLTSPSESGRPTKKTKA